MQRLKCTWFILHPFQCVLHVSCSSTRPLHFFDCYNSNLSHFFILTTIPLRFGHPIQVVHKLSAANMLLTFPPSPITSSFHLIDTSPQLCPTQCSFIHSCNFLISVILSTYPIDLDGSIRAFRSHPHLAGWLFTRFFFRCFPQLGINKVAFKSFLI